MAAAGDGYNIHVTGLTHDEKGYPVMTVEAQYEMMDRLMGKVQKNLDHIIRTEGYRLDDAEVVMDCLALANAQLKGRRFLFIRYVTPMKS